MGGSVPNLGSRRKHPDVHASLHARMPKMMRLNNGCGINLKLDTTTSDTQGTLQKKGSEEMSEPEIWRRDAKYHPLDTTQLLPP